MRVRSAKAAVRAVAVGGTVAVGMSFAPAALAVPATTVAVPCNAATLASDVAAAGPGQVLSLAGCQYNLSGTLKVNTTLTLRGSRKTTLVGGGSGSKFSILTVGPSGDVTTSNVSFNSGYAPTGLGAHGGGAIYNDLGGSVTVNGGTFSSNTAASTQDGGAIYSDGGTLAIAGATFSGNTAGDGGAVYDESGSPTTSTVNYSTFTGNSSSAASGEGGAVDIEDTATMDHDQFSGNTAYYGAAVYVGDGTSFSVTHSAFTGNGSTGNYEGGGLEIAISDATASADTFTSNTSQYGGGVYVYDGPTTLSQDKFSYNTASYYGGAIYSEDTMNLNRSSLVNNSAGEYGGGLYNDDIATLSADAIKGNSAGDDGGGLYNDDDMTLSGVSVTSNTPDNCGPVNSLPGCVG